MQNFKENIVVALAGNPEFMRRIFNDLDDVEYVCEYLSVPKPKNIAEHEEINGSYIACKINFFASEIAKLA